MDIFLDADERITEALAASICDAVIKDEKMPIG